MNKITPQGLEEVTDIIVDDIKTLTHLDIGNEDEFEIEEFENSVQKLLNDRDWYFFIAFGIDYT